MSTQHQDRSIVQKKNAKDIAIDTTIAATESTAEVALDNLPVLASTLNDAGLQGAAMLLADGVLSAVAPGALGFVLNYRLRRMERNLVTLINELSGRLNIVNERLDSLKPDTREKFINGSYRDAFLDSVVEENEPEKVSRNVNAFVNLMGCDNLDDSFVLSLFDDLTRLNRLDIRVLKLHYYNPFTGYDTDDDYQKLLAEEDINHEQYRAIQKKMLRLGLLDSKNEKKREENLEATQKALAELLKQLEKKNPRLPKPPKIQRINLSDSYSITPLGREYLELIRPISDTQTKGN